MLPVLLGHVQCSTQHAQRNTSLDNDGKAPGTAATAPTGACVIHHARVALHCAIQCQVGPAARVADLTVLLMQAVALSQCMSNVRAACYCSATP